MQSRLHICAAMAVVLAMPMALEVRAADAAAPAAAGEKVTLNIKGMT
jgi:hypothetical protein